MEGKIDFEDFAKIEFKIGEIKSAGKVEGSEKLLKLEVDLGEEKNRQILAGISQYYSPEELIGRKAIFAANLKARKMAGLESDGMILAGKDEVANLLGLIAPDKDLPVGIRIG